MSGTIRSFFAFDIEDQTIIRRLSKVQAMLVNTGADLKIVKCPEHSPDNQILRRHTIRPWLTQSTKK